MLKLDASSKEAISGITGYSDDDMGLTLSLGAFTTAGRNWGPHGDHNPDDDAFLEYPRGPEKDGSFKVKNYKTKSLRNSPDANLRLRFLSGDQTYHRWILRWLPSYN